MNIKSIKWAIIFLCACVVGNVQAETLIATASNLQKCQWVQLYAPGVGGPQTDSLYCYDTASDKNNKILERVIFGSYCRLNYVSVGYRINGEYCQYMEVYKADMLPPTNVRAVVAGNSIQVSWTNAVNPTGSPQTTEVLPFRGVKVSMIGVNTGYTDSSFLKDQYYFYNVRACLGENCSAWSTASNAVISYSVVPPYVFQTPKKGTSVLGVEPNPLSGTNYLPGDSVAFIAASTATQFCKEQAYQAYDSYELVDNYGNGSAFYARGAWFYHGGVAFKQLVNVHCR